MHGYEHSLFRFRALREKHIQHGVLETDLPFLFESRENDTGVLLIHGSEATPCNTYELGKKLFEKGFNVLGVLLQGHGINPYSLHNGGVTWKDCYYSAMECFEILDEMTERKFILGSSFGGSLAYLMGIELENRVSGIIAISSPSYTRHNMPEFNNWFKQINASMKAVEHNIHNLDVPVLIMHSVDDVVVKSAHALSAFEKVKSEQKKLILYNKVGHSLGFGFNTDEVANDINNFIVSYKPQKPVRFELVYHDAGSVNLAGDFNNWNSKSYPMFNEDGKWVLDLFLSQGVYQYKFVINHHNWILDPKARRKIAPKGEINSVVIVD